MLRRVCAVAGLLLPLAAVAVLGDGMFAACQAPVSDEAVVTVKGKVLNRDGTPAVGVTVKLLKSDLDLLDVDWVIGAIVNVDSKAFMDTETGPDGTYAFEFSGDEANSNNQMWAAYFVVSIVSPDDPENQLAVATDSFSFSNQKLDKAVPDVRFWDLDDANVKVEADKVSVSWEETDLPPQDGRYITLVESTNWVAEVEGLAWSLPLTALEPCTEPIKDDPAECEAKTEHRVQVISLTDGLRYRTAWHKFTATNPKGLGLRYRDPDDNTTGHSCSGKNLMDLNDGKFSGENAVQWAGNGLEKADLRCLLVDLQEEVELDLLYLHNGAIWFHKNSKVKFSLASGEQPQDADFSEIYRLKDNTNRFWNVNLEIPGGGKKARWLKIEFDNSDDAGFWEHIGEITVYTMEVPTT